MKKYVVETIQTVTRRYYVEAEHRDFAKEGVECGEFKNQEFARRSFSEDILSIVEVEEFPPANQQEEADTPMINVQEGGKSDVTTWRTEVREVWPH